MSEPTNQPDNVPQPDGGNPPPSLTTLPPGMKSLRMLQADDLFGDSKEVLIQNGNDVYRLRRTRSGKLILCK